MATNFYVKSKDGTLVQTKDPSMGTEFYVKSNDGTPVKAKYLETNGKYIHDAKGKPYVVPDDFNWNTYMKEFEKRGKSLAADEADWSDPSKAYALILGLGEDVRYLRAQFHPGGPSDVQRVHGHFFPAFTPVASFLYGAACAAAGLAHWAALAGGGAQNLLSWYHGLHPDMSGAPWPPDNLPTYESPVDISGKYWNAPENVPNIENGWNFYKNGLYGPSHKAEGQKESGKPADQPARQPGPHTEAPQWMKTPAGTGARAGTGRPPVKITPPGLPKTPAPNRLERPSFLDPFWTSSPSFMPSSPSSQSRNPLASPSEVFEQPYEKSHSPVRPTQAGPPSSPPGKPFYSLKDKLDFIRRVYPLAKDLSNKTGLSLPFIFPHTAHEVAWGKNIEGNNLFNLKADQSWHGPTYKRGATAYRAYPSYDESMKDYLAFLDGNPRMSKMLAPVIRESAGRLGDAIHYSGYSDDPLYRSRIMATAKDPLMKMALWQFDRLPQNASQEG